MKVLITTSTFPLSKEDGTPRFVFDLAKGLSNFCAVDVLAPDGLPSSARDSSERFGIHRFSYWWPKKAQTLAYGRGMRQNLQSSWLARAQVLPYFASLANATRRKIAVRQVDVVNSHWLLPQGLVVGFLRGRSQARFHHVVSVHAGDLYLLQRVPWGGALARYVLARTDFVMTDGSLVLKDLENLVGHSVPAIVQPMGADTERFANGPTPSIREVPFPSGYLLFVGRLVEKKGVEFLLEALPRILNRHPGMGLVVVGYGEREELLRQRVNELSVTEKVLFVGRKGHGEVAKYLRGARVVVVPSVVDSLGETDGMPTVVVEAMATGARVVGSRVDGIPDVIKDRSNGWLCREKDPFDLAEKILAAIEDERSGDVVEKALATAKSFDWARVSANYFDVFNSLLEGRTPKEPVSAKVEIHT